MTIADAIVDTNAQDALEAKLRHALERRMTDHHAPLKPEVRACLQPVNGSSPRLLDIPLRWHPYHIKKEAIDQSNLCDGVPEGDAKDTCREEKYGQAVMWAEPEIAGQCRTANAPNYDLDAVAECAKRKFLSAWANNDGVVPAPAPDRWTMPGSCNPTGTPAQRKQRLRDLLRASLAAGPDATLNQDTETRPRTAAATPADDMPSPPPPPLSDTDEAYCSYMARADVRGELTPGGATPIPPECQASIAAAEALKAQQQKDGPPPFTMSDVETDREIAKLLGPAEQKSHLPSIPDRVDPYHLNHGSSDTK
jgi:hypothetical protein